MSSEQPRSPEELRAMGIKPEEVEGSPEARQEHAPRFEHAVKSVRFPDLEEELKKFQQEGWELVSTTTDPHPQGNPGNAEYTLFFKRPWAEGPDSGPKTGQEN